MTRHSDVGPWLSAAFSTRPDFCLVLAWLQHAGGAWEHLCDLIHFLFKTHLLCVTLCPGVERITGNVKDILSFLLEPKVRQRRKISGPSIAGFDMRHLSARGAVRGSRPVVFRKVSPEPLLQNQRWLVSAGQSERLRVLKWKGVWTWPATSCLFLGQFLYTVPVEIYVSLCFLFYLFYFFDGAQASLQLAM